MQCASIVLWHTCCVAGIRFRLRDGLRFGGPDYFSFRGSLRAQETAEVQLGGSWDLLTTHYWAYKPTCGHLN